MLAPFGMGPPGFFGEGGVECGASRVVLDACGEEYGVADGPRVVRSADFLVCPNGLVVGAERGAVFRG